MANQAHERRPRLGFLGTGRIGLRRLQAVGASGVGEVTAFCDPSEESAARARTAAPGAHRAHALDELLDMDLDGIVVATPSAGHAAQAIAALERGIAVFCQTPIGRSEAEAAAVIAAAAKADRLFGADTVYRGTAAARALKREVESGRLGKIFAVDLVFHAASAPDMPWLRDRTLSGGGCVIDQGAHLIDLALWILGFPAIERVDAQLYAAGTAARPDQVEDYATAQIVLATGTTLRLACSWRLHAGVEADMSATVHGTHASAGIHNPAGGLRDFAAFRNVGTQRETLVAPSEDWEGRIVAEWARRLATDRSFDSAARHLTMVATAVERIYRSGFSLGIDGRQYQSVEPFFRVAARADAGAIVQLRGPLAAVI